MCVSAVMVVAVAVVVVVWCACLIGRPSSDRCQAEREAKSETKWFGEPISRGESDLAHGLEHVYGGYAYGFCIDHHIHTIYDVPASPPGEISVASIVLARWCQEDLRACLYYVVGLRRRPHNRRHITPFSERAFNLPAVCLLATRSHIMVANSAFECPRCFARFVLENTKHIALRKASSVCLYIWMCFGFEILRALVAFHAADKRLL